jgi:uncharacterized protein (TIGR04255 family)
MQLPTRLGKEPIVDAVFEVRFRGTLPGPSNVLPGFLYSKLGSSVRKVEELPAAQIPAAIRASDPNLANAPLTRIHWGAFFILVGDSVLTLSCSIPYPRWQAFRQAIVELYGHLADLPFITQVDRWSMKYVDLFDFPDPLNFLRLGIQIGDQKLSRENFQLRVELPRGDKMHVIQAISSANAQLMNGEFRSGSMLDVDTIFAGSPLPKDAFISRLPDLADDLHRANKELFFECLSEAGLRHLEPSYE